MSMTNAKGVALITGASSGIGATYAERLAQRGYDVLLVARDVARLEALASRLSGEAGIKAEVLKADLTLKADLAVVEQRLRHDDSISLLVNNAGFATIGSLIETDLDLFENMVQLNVIALTRLAAAAATRFAARKSGTIINIASVLALAPEVFNGSYSASKAYVLALSQNLSAEIGPSGVRVQAVLPGRTQTEIWERSGIDPATLPADGVMGVEEMVDAALSGFDQGELVTIPSLPNVADWHALDAARKVLGPNLSLNHAAERYKRTPA